MAKEKGWCQVKVSTIITIAFLAIVLFSGTIFYVNYSNLQEEAAKAKHNYEFSEELNQKVQETKDAELAKNAKDIKGVRLSLSKVNKEYRDFESASQETIEGLRKDVKLKPKWKIIKEKGKTEYVYLPFKDYGDMKLELVAARIKIPLLEKLIKKWKLSYNIMFDKFKFEAQAHKNAKVYINVLEKKKRVPMWLKLTLGALIGYAIIK